MKNFLQASLVPAVLATLYTAACSSGAAPPALTGPDSGGGSGPGSGTGTGVGGGGGGDSGPVTGNDSGKDGGGPRPTGFYVPAGCPYAITPATTLGYMSLALDDNASAGPMSTAAPQRVRLGLGGNVTAGQAGYADPTTTAAFTWETGAANTAAKVQFGDSPTTLKTVQTGYVWTLPGSTPVYMHEVHVCGLTPGKTYYYQVGGGASGAEIWSATQSFTTLPATGSITLSMSGDARDDHNVWQIANERIKQKNVDAMLFSGDLTLFGSVESDYVSWLDAIWQDPNNAGQFLTLGEILFLPVAGNHEYDDSTGMTDPAWLSQFAMPGSGPYAKTFGSYNIGNSHFVYIDDSELASTPAGTDNPEVDAQLAWLKADLMAAEGDRTKHPFVFVYNHRGLFSTSNHAADSDVLQARTILAPIFAQFHVDGVFNGHDHEYERTVPIVPGTPINGDPTPKAGGTVYTISAGVGALPYAVGTGSQSWRAIKVPFGSQAMGVNSFIGTYSTLVLNGNTVVLTAYGLTTAGPDPVIDTYTFMH